MAKRKAYVAAKRMATSHGVFHEGQEVPKHKIPKATYAQWVEDGSIVLGTPESVSDELPDDEDDDEDRDELDDELDDEEDDELSQHNAPPKKEAPTPRKAPTKRATKKAGN